VRGKITCIGHVCVLGTGKQSEIKEHKNEWLQPHSLELSQQAKYK
jgi:hypothetical protein